MQHFYNRLNGWSERSDYWQSLAVLRLTKLDAITGSNIFLTWEMW